MNTNLKNRDAYVRQHLWSNLWRSLGCQTMVVFLGLWITPLYATEPALDHGGERLPAPPQDLLNPAPAPSAEPTAVTEAAGSTETAAGVEPKKVSAKVDPVGLSHSHWGYGPTNGPIAWADLDPNYRLCREGREQSPVDLRWRPLQGKRDLQFFYKEGTGELRDNGHAIEMRFSPGSYVMIDGGRFDLVQMHLHAKSEHTLSGRHFPFETHWVHRDTSGQLAVVGVFVGVETKSAQLGGSKNVWLDSLLAEVGNLGSEKNPAQDQSEPSHQDTQLTRALQYSNPEQALPVIRTHYHYRGSLTTPPCAEGVNWTVMNTSIEISSESAALLSARYHNNYRPTQSLHQRKTANF